MATAGDQIIEPEAPRDDDDNDSAIDSRSIGTDYTSLASSIAKYRSENGRTYHSFQDGKYLLPNDDVEQDRLDLQHHMMTMTFHGKLCVAPVKDIPLKRVLDVGTGTGLWAMDFADEHPDAHVIGIDLSPIQPKFVPPNCEFVVDDVESEWTYSEDKKFDFIYIRMMTAAIRDWPKLFQQAFEHLNPGGYIEVTDGIMPFECQDDTMDKESPIIKYSSLVHEASLKAGSPIDSGLYTKERLINAGFVNVVETKYKWPLNTWPKDRHLKELGAWTCENLSQGVEALCLAFFTRVLNWTPEEVQVFLVDVRKDLKDTTKHGYIPLVGVVGQKPKEEKKD